MLIVVILIAVMLIVIMLIVVMLIVIMLIVVMLIVIMLIVVMLIVVILIVVMLIVIIIIVALCLGAFFNCQCTTKDNHFRCQCSLADWDRPNRKKNFFLNFSETGKLNLHQLGGIQTLSDSIPNKTIYFKRKLTESGRVRDI